MGRLILSLLLAATMTPGVRYHGRRWKYIARTRRTLDGRRCTACGGNGGMLHVHHRRPIAQGGNHYLWNLQTLCPRCHELEHGWDIDHDGHIGRRVAPATGGH